MRKPIFSYIFKSLLLSLTLLFLNGCGVTMAMVMRDCDKGQPFNSYANCIRASYEKDGIARNEPSVRAFYANLRAIQEKYDNKKLTDAEAKSATYSSYMSTIKIDNDIHNRNW